MQRTIFTIGHSTHSQQRLLELLQLHQIGAICDVRSQPYSRVNSQFNREDLKEFLRHHEMAYVFLGKELGARSQDRRCYENGRVQYERLAETELFRSGVRRIQDGMGKYRIALMCAEKEPLDCHRTILVSRRLIEDGLEVQHIHASGKLESHSDAVVRLIQKLGIPDMFLSFEKLRAEAYKRQAELIAYNTFSVEKDEADVVRSVLH